MADGAHKITEPQMLDAFVAGVLTYAKYKTKKINGELTPMFDFTLKTHGDHPTLISGVLFGDKARAAKELKKGAAVRMRGIVRSEEWGDEGATNSKVVFSFNGDNDDHGIEKDADKDPVNMVHIAAEVVWVGERNPKKDGDGLGPLNLNVCNWALRRDGTVKRSSSIRLTLIGDHAELDVKVGDVIDCEELAIANQKDEESGRSFGKLLATQESTVKIAGSD